MHGGVADIELVKVKLACYFIIELIIAYLFIVTVIIYLLCGTCGVRLYSPFALLMFLTADPDYVPEDYE